jgi:hypothetical protein
MNNKIEPRYVDFNTAKLLKEKGLVANCKRYWVKYTNTEYKEMSDVELEDLDREIGIGGNLIIPKYEQWQVVEWLRDNHGIWVYADFLGSWMYVIVLLKDNSRREIHHFNSPQKAYSAAFDYILKKLI